MDLRTIIDQSTAKGASVRFIKEVLVFSATDQHPRATLMLGILGSFAEFERSIIRERQAEGIALAKRLVSILAARKHSHPHRQNRLAIGSMQENRKPLLHKTLEWVE